MNWLIKHKYLYFPLLVLTLYFALDRVFALESYKMFTMDDAPYLIFEHKEELLKKMPVVVKQIRQKNENLGSGVKRQTKTKSLLILGTSRLLFIRHNFFKRNYPDWEFFNFSGPVTYPAYYLYILERALQKGLRPELIIVETAPFQYSEGSDAFLRSNVAHSFDLKFIWEHFDLFKRDEVSYFIARYLFNGYRYPPKYKNISKRLKNIDKDITLLTFKALMEFQKKNRGSIQNIIPKDNWYQTDLATMHYQANHKTIPWLYSNYKISDRQFSFLEKILKLSKENNIKVLLVKPAVSESLLKATKKKAKLNYGMQEYEKRLEKILKKYPVEYMDFNQSETYKCNTFVDDAHMSIDCYNLMVDEMMNQYYLP